MHLSIVTHGRLIGDYHAQHPKPCTTGRVHLLVYYIKLKSRLSVRLHFLSRDNLGCLCMDRRETWFVYRCGLWHMNAPLNNLLTVLCWAHERFKHTAVVVFAIIFGRVKY